MVEVDKDQYYYMDLDKINNWIFINNSDRNDVEHVVARVKDENGFDVEKVLKIEGNPKEIHSNIRYEILKDMFFTLFNGGIESEGGDIHFTQEIDNLSISNKIILNTLMKYGFLVDKMDIND